MKVNYGKFGDLLAEVKTVTGGKAEDDEGQNRSTRPCARSSSTEGARLVFWHDPTREFADYVAGGLTGDLAGVQVLDVAEVGGLSAKLRLEREDPARQVPRLQPRRERPGTRRTGCSTSGSTARSSTPTWRASGCRSWA